MRHEQDFEITFGDCDPAGIVFYPNIFRWMDAAFHGALRRHGGHAKLCARLEAVGIGLADASAQFRHTMRDGDRLTLAFRAAKWSQRSVTLAYEGRGNDILVFEGREVRCLFKLTQTGIVAADLAELRTHLEDRVV
mgnify:FL=1